MRLVLLPGMDGTGYLFAPFIREFGATAQVVRYPISSNANYAELEQLVRRELPPREDFFLLGESFSGPVSIGIAADPPINLKGLVLCCTFANAPRPLLAPLRHLLPILPAPPIGVLEALLCGRFANTEVRELLARTMEEVPLHVLKARLRAAASVDAISSLRRLSVPALYLRANEDRVVPLSAFHKIAEVAKSVRGVDLVAPHFLLQTVPQQAASVIEEFMEEVRHAA